MYHYQKLKSLLLLLFVAVTAKAQLSDGKVYNFVNVGNPEKSMTSATAGNYLSIATTDQTDYSQLWYVASDGNGITLRNLGNGNYLRSPNAGGNTNWTLVKTVDSDNCRFSCTQVSGHDVLRAINTTDSYHYMHYGATTGTVVCWTSSADATQWDFTEVSGITSAQLNANWEALAAINPSDAVIGTYQSALDELFSDKACTELNSAFASMTETKLKEQQAYKNLPTTLQQMVLKVHGGDDAWGEENYDTNKEDWDAAYAKKYRVQLYEPYNEPEAAAAALGLNAHTNLNNPTGIFSGGREAMYVMVEGEIEEGASLYLASYSGHGKLGGYQNGVELKTGLNVVPSYFAGNNYCINYVVHTFNTEGGTKKGNKAKARKLSDYEDLKIHIEGGYINGYWNKMGDDLYTPDQNENWDYIAARATQTDVTVLGEYITLQFPLGSAVDNDGNTNNGLSYYYTGKNIIESSIQEWDNVMMWERIVLGVLDKEATMDATNNVKSPYSDHAHVIDYTGDDTDGFESGYGDYYNVHGLSFGTPHGYMYGGWDHCGYHFNTMGAIMTSMITDAGSHWGPAHEIGHQHQGLLTVNGLTEVTNNLFSNVVLWYFGKTTSRVNGSALEPIAEMFANEEADFFNTTSNVFITTQMYYKLFLYYHVLGHNPKFYPKLFEMLRQDPMSGGYNQNGSTSILHFYKKCCEAAGEDLTEFFRAYGFFRVMTNRLVGDYSNSVYNQTQEDIDDAIAEVKALAETKGWEENIAVLFINDDTGGQILSHRSDTEYLTPFESADSELGSYATFNEATTPNYTYTIVGTTVTMEGEGGIGFAIYNENGEIIGFSDNKTFEVSVECAEAIASGKAVVKTVQGDNEAVEAVNIMDTDDTDAKRAMLGELVESAKAVLDLSDEDGTKVGFYRASSLEALESAYTQAEQVYEARTVASYSAVYNALFHEYFEVMNDSYARTGLVEGNSYRLTNKAYPTRLMTVNTNNNQMFGLEESTDNPNSQLWYLESSDTEGRYYLKNKATSKYPGDVSTGAVLSANQEKDAAHAYELRDMGNGLWALVGSTGLHCSESQSYNIVGWGADSDATQWYITAVDVNENAEALFSLQGMIEKTKDLAGEMANVQYSGKLALQAVSESEPYYLSTNACHNTLNNASDGQGLAGLLDDDTETFFHSDYGGKISNTHYLQVDLGSGNTMSKFAFNYTTRSNGNNCPTEIVVAGSNSPDGTFTTLQTYTAASDGLPDGNALSWESPVIENTANYRYLRFSVTATENSKIYFVMSTFGITNHETVVKSIEEKYSTAGLIEQTLKDLGEKFFEANELMASDAATSADLQRMCSSIEESYYTPLLAIYNNANAARLTALKEELDALIGKTTDLIGQCGTVTYTPGTFKDKAPLQTTDAEGDFYVRTNAQENDEGPISHLVDGNQNTYFHSDYSGANSTDGKDHHITIKLGNNVVSKFKFKYITRHDAETNYPATIVVLGSVDGTDFEEIKTITGLPTGNAKTYESEYIKPDKSYSHLRFMVTATNNNNLQGGHPIFHMAEFELAIEGLPENYTAELKPEAGDAGTDLLIETFKQNAEAQGVYKYATTELQVEAAIAKLQAQYDILETAKNAVRYVDFTINANVTGGGVTYNEVEHTETLRASSTLTAGDLAAMPVDGYVAKSIIVNGTTIFVIYNKVYTVKVTGGNGNGGVAYGEGDYMNNDTIQVLGALDVNQLEKIVPEGYELKEEITIDNETGYIHVVFSAIPLVYTDKYYTFECISEYAHSTERFIRDNGSVINGRSSEGSLFQFEKANDDNGYYIKSYVTDKYLNHDNGAVYASSERLTIWKMEKPSHTPDARTLTVGNNLYLNNNDTDCTNNSCTNLQSKEHSSGVNSDNACSLWTITEGTPLDKSALNTLIGETNTLIESCYTDEKFYYAGSLNVTEELMTATREAVTVAQEKYDSKATTESEYEAALNALKTAKDNLQTAINYANLPVQLTFDANSPVTYKIKIARANTPVLAYDESSSMVAVTAFELGNKSHGWYFMATTDGKVRIMPYHELDTTLALSTNSFAQDNSKVKGMPIGTDGYTQEWTITNANMNEANRNAGWYNITTINPSNTKTTWYFSNHGGVSNKMGFYNDADDDGSRFQFEKISFDKSEAYYTLYNYYHGETKVSGTITGGAGVGYYPETEAETYNTAYSNAANVLEDATATDEEYTNAYNALKDANEALNLIMPEVGKYYTIVSACNDNNRNGQLMYATGENAMHFANDKKSSDDSDDSWIRPEALWTFTAEGYMMNLQTGCYVSTSGWGAQLTLVENGAKVVAIESLTTGGQVLLKPEGGYPLHAQVSGSKIVGYINDNNASAWRIVEVGMANVKHKLTIGELRHAGLYLNYSVEIPEGVQVYIAHTSDGTTGEIIADELEGSIIPARTAVIVKGNEGTYEFKYTTDENDDDDFSANLLGGSAYLKYQQVAQEGNRCCAFGQRGGVVGLYKNYIEYIDANGSQTRTIGEGESATTESFVKTDNGTHFMVPANKVYYEYEPLPVANASAFRFRFISSDDEEDDTTTTIDGLLFGSDAVIYNLYGQRIVKVVVPGFYIVNGKKMYVSEKMILNND